MDVVSDFSHETAVKHILPDIMGAKYHVVVGEADRLDVSLHKRQYTNEVALNLLHTRAAFSFCFSHFSLMRITFD